MKLIFTLLLFMIFLSAANAQQDSSYYNLTDTALIPDRRMPQHRDFLDSKYDFPARPRHQWEVGIKGGMLTVSGDVPAVLWTPGFGIHVRKALGYAFSLRLEYINGVAKGLHWRYAENFAKNSAWSGYAAPVRTNTGEIVSSTGSSGFDRVYYNYKTNIQDLSLQGILTLNNINFHRRQPILLIYGMAAVGVTVYDTKVNALDENGNRYDFASITPGSHSNHRKTIKALKNLLDNSYETPADRQGDRRPEILGGTLKPSASVGMGLTIRLSPRINLALEDRWTFTKDDVLDGQRWQEQGWGDATLTRDFDSYNYVSLGLNINLGSKKKSVQPLQWDNPLNYIYGSIRNQGAREKFRDMLQDSDEDGILDFLDKEPNTPKGCPVDTHGVMKDTDADGVPDCKDKEPITPTRCQPVNADGIGKCPEPACCDSLRTNGHSGPIGGGHDNVSGCTDLLTLPPVIFDGNSYQINKERRAILSLIAARLKNSPSCKLRVTGYCDETDKLSRRLSWDRVNAVIDYLVEKEGISRDRLHFIYAQTGGECNSVKLKGTTGDVPVTTPPPPAGRGF